jgi:protein TonB
MRRPHRPHLRGWTIAVVVHGAALAACGLVAVAAAPEEPLPRTPGTWIAPTALPIVEPPAPPPAIESVLAPPPEIEVLSEVAETAEPDAVAPPTLTVVCEPPLLASLGGPRRRVAPVTPAAPAAPSVPRTVAESAEPKSAPAAPAGPATPVALERVAPTYPESARRSGAEGAVQVRLVIAGDGTVREAEVLVSSGAVALDRAAVAALRRWRFEPSPQDERVLEQRVAFRLQ